MMPLETKVLLKLLADAALGAKSTLEIYELISKLADEDEVITEPYHIAEECNTAKEKDGEEAKWPYFNDIPYIFR